MKDEQFICMKSMALRHNSYKLYVNIINRIKQSFLNTVMLIVKLEKIKTRKNILLQFQNLINLVNNLLLEFCPSF